MKAFHSWFGRRWLRRSWHWGGCLGWVMLSGGVGVLAEAIASPPAHASTSRVTLTLQREENESYQTLVRRSLAAARAATQRSFDADILVTDVVVTIVAENRGLAAPVLALAVSRAEWRSRPDPQQWATYFNASRALLELDQPADALDANFPPPPAPEAIADPAVIPLPEVVPGTPQLPAAAPGTP